MSVHIPPDVFAQGLLDKTYHERLIADLPRLASKAGIPPAFVWSRLSDYCSAKDLAWVRNLRDHYDQGLIYSGTNFSIPVEDKMMAIAGACLRNYINAKVVTVQSVIMRLKNDDMPSPTVILVPNFCMAKEDVSSVAPWEAASLLGWLYSRLAQNQKTVLYVGNMKTLEAVYGEAMARHLKAHYTII